MKKKIQKQTKKKDFRRFQQLQHRRSFHAAG